MSRSLNVSDNQLVNLFPEIVETKDGKDVGAFYPAPGLTLKTTCGAGPIRGMAVWTLQGGTQVLLVVSGTQVFLLTPSFASTLCTGIALQSGSTACSIITNNTQAAIFFGGSATYQDGFGLVNNGSGYLVNSANVVSGISLPFSPSVGSNQWWQSNLFDLSTWQALNFTSSAGAPDNVQALFDIHREVWVLKSNETEIWANAGLPGFAFQRLDGVYIQTGISAPSSLAASGESMLWLAQNSNGQAIVVEAVGYQVRPVSTQALTTIWQGYATTADAEGFAFQQGGHRFYQITFPTAGVSWRYDLTSSDLAGVPMWHQVAGFSAGQFTRHPARTGVFFAGLNLVGDYQNGNIYALDPTAQLDNGAQRKWLRTWRALPKAVNMPMRFTALEIQMMTGMQVPAGTTPQCMLRWSDDGGHSWSDQRIAAAGPTGQTAQRVKFNRLGATRRNTGLDRIFELSSTDQFGVALTGAELL